MTLFPSLINQNNGVYVCTYVRDIEKLDNLHHSRWYVVNSIEQIYVIHYVFITHSICEEIGTNEMRLFINKR